MSSTRWVLRRQDDNGNRDIVEVFDSRSEAEARCDHYERKGHKQMYWVERATDQDEGRSPGGVG